MKKLILLSETEVKYVQDMIVARDTVKLGMSRKELIQVILYIVQEGYYFKEDYKQD